MMKNELKQEQLLLIEAMRFSLNVLLVFIHVLLEPFIPIQRNFSGLNLYHIFSEMIFLDKVASLPFAFIFGGGVKTKLEGECK